MHRLTWSRSWLLPRSNVLVAQVCIVALALVGAVLGWVGITQHTDGTQTQLQPRSISYLAYYDLELFFAQSPVLAMGGHTPWELQGARFLAPFATVLALAGNLGIAVASGIRRSRLRRARRHGDRLGFTRTVGMLARWLRGQRSEQRAQPIGIASAYMCTRLAGLIVGRRRSHLREAWLADLRLDPSNQQHSSARKMLNVASGFILAAVRIRIIDSAVVRLCAHMIDGVLISPRRTRAAIDALLGLIALKLYTDIGFDSVIADVVAFPVLSQGLDAFAKQACERRGITSDQKTASGTDQQPPVSGDDNR